MKARTNLLIEEKVLKKAHELGINISQACENALIIYIQTMTKVNAWFGRQTHNLENKTGQVRPSVQRSRARIPPPAPFYQLKPVSWLFWTKKFDLGVKNTS
jgi:post-segregation antitoxin (ccd killing protein)